MPIVLRTTAELVEGIVEVEDDILLDPFMEAANALVTEVCASALQTDDVTPYYDDDRLLLIETWLSAHFYAVRERRSIEESARDVRLRFEGKVETGLAVTEYGQQAMRLDTHGGLALLDNTLRNIESTTLPVGGITGRVSWLGTDNDIIYP